MLAWLQWLGRFEAPYFGEEEVAVWGSAALPQFASGAEDVYYLCFRDVARLENDLTFGVMLFETCTWEEFLCCSGFVFGAE